MRAHCLRITSYSIGTTKGSKVELDGREIAGITSIKLTGARDDAWRCELEFLPGALDVDVVLSELLAGAAPAETDEICHTDYDAPNPFNIGKPPEAA